MFVGMVQCEFELSRAHDAIKGHRLMLVTPLHDVEWDGDLLAIDTVGAQVTDYVVVALAPLGSGFDVPADLPIDGAIVGLVESITKAQDGEDDAEAAPQAREEEPEERPSRGRRGRSGGGGRSGSSRSEDSGSSSRRSKSEPKSEPAEEKKRAPRSRSKPKRAPKEESSAPASGGGDDGGFDIVWDGPDEKVGDTTKRKAPRRR